MGSKVWREGGRKGEREETKNEKGGEVKLQMERREQMGPSA